MALVATVLGLSAATQAAAQARLGEDPIGALLEQSVSADPGHWRISQFQISPSRKGAVSSLRITTNDVAFAPGGLPLSRDRAGADGYAYEVALVRDWPGAVNVDAGRYTLDLSPHAGVGIGPSGSSAEAGATLRLGRRVDDAVLARLKDMGVRDGASFGDAGRWYLFAAASGRAVGMNVQRSADGWNGRGWSTDPAAATIADAQVGVGWRRGPMQTSLGYIRREVKSDYKVWGQETKAASLVALSFSIKPGN